MSIFVGIDVAARSFDLVSRRDGKNSKAETFPQTAQGRTRAIRKLQALQPACIVLEATGIYHLDLALALHEAGLPVCVINPRSFRHFAEITLRGSKTDPLDAALLAEYAERMTPRRWTPPPPIYRELRDLGRHINRLMHARTQAKNQLHALTAHQGTSQLLIEDAEEGITQLDQRISSRGRGCPRRPLTPPYVRFRIRRFMKDTGVGASCRAATPAPSDQSKTSGRPRSCGWRHCSTTVRAG